MTTNCLRTEYDFRQVVVDWDAMLNGYCNGVQQARENHGLEVRLTPDITRNASLDEARTLVGHTARHRDRGVVGIGLGGEKAAYRPEPFAPAFRDAADAGLGSVPHAGEVAGPTSIQAAIDALGADRVRHGIRAIEDPTLLGEIIARDIVLDVAPVSNLRTGAVASLDEHPLPDLLDAGVMCSVSTDARPCSTPTSNASTTPSARWASTSERCSAPVR